MIDIQFYTKVFELKKQLMAGLRLDRQELWERFEGLRSPEPVVYNIETTNACNMRCQMCPRTTMMTRPIETMGLEDFRRIASQLRAWTPAEWAAWEDFAEKAYGVPRQGMSENHFFLYVIPKVVVLHGYGDPLLDKHMPQRLAIMRDQGVPSYFSCNPANIDVERVVEMFENGLGYIKYSVESADDERHKEVRGPASNFSEAYRKIMRLMEIKAQRGLETVIVITMLNLNKSWQSEEFAKVQEAFAGTGAYVYLKSQDQLWYNQTGAQTQSIHWLEFCQFPWSSMTIKSDGLAVECVEDYNNEIVLGDAKINSLKDIWNGESYRRFRADHFTLTPGLKCSERCDMRLIGQFTTELGSPAA